MKLRANIVNKISFLLNFANEYHLLNGRLPKKVYATDIQNSIRKYVLNTVVLCKKYKIRMNISKINFNNILCKKNKGK